MAKEITLREFHCFRCDKDFMSALRPPKSCGKCKSKSWNKQRAAAAPVRRRARGVANEATI